MKEEYFTTGDVAKLAGVSNQAIDNAVRAGNLTVAFKTVGGFRLIRRDDALKFSLTRKRKGSSSIVSDLNAKI